MSHPRTSGFTLVELSIVLVILGLLTGGILTGQSLIRAAELRSIVTEFQRYQTAAQTFRDKYRALPGDMKNARAFWADGNTSEGCIAVAGAPMNYNNCNGDGDGKIGYAAYNNFKTAEVSQFWRQLALAGLIEGDYSGQGTMNLNSSLTAPLQKGCHVLDYLNDEAYPTSPPSRASNLRWFTAYNPHCIWSSLINWSFDYNYGHYLLVGKPGLIGSPAVFPGFVSVLKPEEVWNIDTKMDDGKPGIGKVLAYPLSCTTVANSAQGSTAEYLLSSTTGQCGLIFTNAY